ncbi:MAG: phytoene desaturase family protein [Microthrixaceae bacterium]
MADEVVDAVVIGGGHNGLVAATVLADAGWDVLVLEAASEPGGAVRSDELHPGFVSDRFSAFYPMTAASPVMRSLDLHSHGLEWAHAPKVLTHLRVDAPAAVLHRDVDRTADELDLAHRGDGAAWRELSAQWDRIGTPMLDALLSPFPPVRAGVRLGWSARSELWDLLRMAVLPVRALAQERFGGVDPALLLAGNALHADVTPDAAPSALLGWLLLGLGQSVGFPAPVGGAGALARALVSRLESAGGQVLTDAPVESVEVHGGRARGVRTVAGTVVRARHGVLAACDAQVLYGRLLAEHDLPAGFVARMRGFERAGGTVKLDYALSTPVPWSDPRATGAGTVHLADSLEELTLTSAQLANRHLPSHPFLLIGQMTTADPGRSPSGTESLWAYTHVPQDITADAAGQLEHRGRLRGPALERFAERMEDRIESHAPGFRDRILARRVVGPDEMEAANASLVGGDISGGTTQLHQQLVFRPVPGLARAETPVAGLFLASSSAHPGGSVHGAAGANAARAALARRRVRRMGARVAVAGAIAAPATAAARRARRHAGGRR